MASVSLARDYLRCHFPKNREKVIMRDKAVRWCDGKIKIMIRITLECGIGRGDKRGECYKRCSEIKELV